MRRRACRSAASASRCGPGRRAAEILECQLHEALLNLAVAPDTPLWLVCPYDLSSLDAEVIVEAHRSHPAVIDRTTTAAAPATAAPITPAPCSGSTLPEPCVPVEHRIVTESNCHELTGWLYLRAAAAGLSEDRADRLSAAVHEISRGGLRDGDGDGHGPALAGRPRAGLRGARRQRRL